MISQMCLSKDSVDENYFKMIVKTATLTLATPFGTILSFSLPQLCTNLQSLSFHNMFSSFIHAIMKSVGIERKTIAWRDTKRWVIDAIEAIDATRRHEIHVPSIYGLSELILNHYPTLNWRVLKIGKRNVDKLPL